MRADALQNDDRLTVSIAEACRLLSIGRTTCYQLISEGRLKTSRIGARRLVHVDSLRELVAEAA